MPPVSSTQRHATPVAAVLAAACMIAQQVGGKATRDALFLSSFPVSELPKAMLAAAVLSIVGVVAMSRALTRFGPARLVPALFACNGVVFGLEWLLVGRVAAVGAAMLYLHVAVVGFTLISGFWSVVNERFDPHTAKQVVGRIATGGILGGLAGGIIAERVATYLDARAMLLVLAALNVLCAVGVWHAAAPATRSAPPRSSEGVADGSAFGHLRASPYLQLVGLLVGLVAVTAGLIDYVFKAHAAREFATSEALMGFFAIFYTVTSFAAVVVQSAAGNRTLSRLGIGGTLALLPSALVAAGLLGAAVMRLWALAVVRGLQAVLESSLFRPAYELLYTPVPPEAKRPTKTLLDVGLDRVGGAIAGALMMLLLAAWPSAANTAALLIAVGVALLSLWVALRLHRGYVEALASSLRSGAVEIDETDVIDATTRRTLSETTRAIDRERLLAEIARLESEQQRSRGTSEAAGLPSGQPSPTASLPTASLSTTPRAGPVAEAPESEASGFAATANVEGTDAAESVEGIDWAAAAELVAERARALCSKDAEQVRRALEGSLARELVPLVIALLGRDEVARAARRALRAAAARITGQLTDAQRDATLPLRARRRVASLLASCTDSRAAAGLLHALEHDDDLELRRRSARSLAHLVEQEPAWAPRRHVAYRAAERELERTDTPDLDHLFVVLGLAQDARALELALRALRSGDDALQGTALEYLDNVLPESIAGVLWSALERLCESSVVRGGPASLRTGSAKRPEHEIVEDLRRSVADRTVDREAIVRANAK